MRNNYGVADLVLRMTVSRPGGSVTVCPPPPFPSPCAPPPGPAAPPSSAAASSSSATARAPPPSTRCAASPSSSRAARFTAIMGPSGSGKSTLMHILAGLDRPTSGWVELDGTRLDALSDRELTLLRRRAIGFVFQSFNLLPVLTAEENIALPRAHRRRPARTAAWVDTLVARRRPRRPARAPPGRAVRRPAAARRHRPRARHPARRSSSPTSRRATSTPRPAARCSTLLRRAVDEFGQTIVMVTHDADAAAVADRVLFLADGAHRRRAARA